MESGNRGLHTGLQLVEEAHDGGLRRRECEGWENLATIGPQENNGCDWVTTG